MTTKVLIVNFGPDHVLVRTYRKDNEPGDDRWITGSQPAAFIPPGSSLERYVHGNEGLLLDEDKLGKFAPPDAGRKHD